MIEFKDRVAIVTGAGRGLGAEHARLLASRGAKVVVNDPGGSVNGIDDGSRPADEVVAGIVAAGGAAVADYHSVADPESGEAIVARAVDEYGKVDILVNNAGILRDRAFHNMALEDIHAVLDVHLRGAFYVTQPAIRVMREHGYGRIVLTSSASGVLGNFGQSNYGAAKAGIAGMTRCMALEGQKYGIRCFILAPVALSRLTEDLPGFQDEGFKAKMDPKLISPLVTYLASDLAKDMTNKTFFVGGGRIAEMKVVTATGITKTDGGGLWTPQEVSEKMSGILLPE